MLRSPNFLWPAAIIALLLLSGVTAFGVLIASQSDGGAQVVHDYYRKSAAWDSLAAEQRASDSLEWNATIEMLPQVEASGVVTITDRDGNGVDGLSGTVTVTRPQSARTFGTLNLVAADSSAGRYSFRFPYADRGLWDLNVRAQRGNERFIKKVRIEI